MPAIKKEKMMSANENAQDLINEMHQDLNDAFMQMQTIAVNDMRSRDARQAVMEAIVNVRKNMDLMGLLHQS
jgi:hypothetical protein